MHVALPTPLNCQLSTTCCPGSTACPGAWLELLISLSVVGVLPFCTPTSVLS